MLYVFVQLPHRHGWIHDPYRLVRKVNFNGIPLPVKRPKTIDDILLTDDLDCAWRFDVDRADNAALLQNIVNAGGTIAVAGNIYKR